MKYKLIKEYNKIFNFLKKEPLIVFSRSIFSDLRFDVFIRFYFYKTFLNNFKYSKSSFNYFCLLTKRTQGVIKLFRISRILLRELSFNGLLPGIKKSSW